MSHFEIVANNAVVKPSRSTTYSAGYDLYANENVMLLPHSRYLVHTGVTCKMEPNEYLAIVPRSGLSIKKGITVLNTPGTVDADYYPNEIGVILYNTTDEPFEIIVGDRIAQAILQEYKVMEDEVQCEIERTSGFGSTGI